MSLLTERLPDHVEAGGAHWPIDPDFRLMVELESAAAAPEELGGEVLGGILVRFYSRGMPSGLEEAVDGMLWFYRCGKEEKNGCGVPSGGRAYDFEQDAEPLYTSFLQAYRVDLSVDRVHWWLFRRLMFGLPAETPFAQRLHYRTADTSAMGKEQKKHYAKMKRLFALRDRGRARETLAQRDARMLAYVERRFMEVGHGTGRAKGSVPLLRV